MACDIDVCVCETACVKMLHVTKVCVCVRARLRVCEKGCVCVKDVCENWCVEDVY